MAALVKDDGTLVHTSLKVSLEGAYKFARALEQPKKPTPKLVALMTQKAARRDK